MKKLLFLTFIFLLGTTFSSHAAFTETKTDNQAVSKSFRSADMQAAAEAFVKLSRKEYEQLTGRHLSLTERLAFKVQQKRLKREIATKQTYGFNIGGFMLGLLLSAVGILLAYAFSQDTNVRTWAWVGAVINLIIILIIII